MQKPNSDCSQIQESPSPTKTKAEIHFEKEHESKDRVLFRLYLAVSISTLFMMAEIAGGIISGSISILTDAFHLLSDILSFCISIISIHLSRRPSSKLLSFGFYRAEVLGALLSMAVIWGLTIWIVSEAVDRIINPVEIDGFIMLITASVGLLANLIMGLILGHEHHHLGHSHDDEHEHAAEDTKSSKESGSEKQEDEHEIKVHKCESHADENEDKPLCGDIAESHDHGHSHGHDDKHSHDHSHDSHDHSHDGHDHSHDHKHHNMGLRAAFIHVIGDCIQSLGVMIAGIIIYCYPNLVIVDPICTLFFAVIVVFTTYGMLRDCMRILMEASPKGLDCEKISGSLSALENVIAVHDVHIWSLSAGKVSFSCHLVVTQEDKYLLESAILLLKNKYKINHVTIQIEEHNPKEKFECDNMPHK